MILPKLERLATDLKASIHLLQVVFARTFPGTDPTEAEVAVVRKAEEYLKKMEQRSETVALFLVDQRMPEMSGTEFLEEALQIYPQAKRVLLTAYADTQAAIDSMLTLNRVACERMLECEFRPRAVRQSAPFGRLHPEEHHGIGLRVRRV